jgi:hypothetical protein
VKHEELRTVACPPSTHTGDVEILCTDGKMSIEKGECFKRCSVDSILGAMEANADDVTSCVYPEVQESLYHWEAKTYECPYGSTGEWEIYCDQGEVQAKGGCTPTECSVDAIHSAMNLNGLDILPTVDEKMLHYEFSACSKGEQTFGCPYGSTGEWKVHCDNAHVKATGGCTSTECKAEDIHKAMTGGERHYPTGSGRVYPWVTETMYHFEFPKVSKGKETLSCPDKSSGSWDVYCDNGEVHASGECEVTSFYGWMPYQTEAEYAEIKSARDGKCLDYVQDGSRSVAMYTCHGRSNQMWRFDQNGYVISAQDGWCLDMDTNNKKVNMYHCHGRENQKWHIDPDGKMGTAYDDLCLDAAKDGSGQVYMYTCNGDSNQLWDHPQRVLNEKAVRFAR